MLSRFARSSRRSGSVKWRLDRLPRRAGRRAVTAAGRRWVGLVEVRL